MSWSVWLYSKVGTSTLQRRTRPGPLDDVARIWTDEEESGGCDGVANAACSFLLMVKIKKYYKVTALSIMSKLFKKKKKHFPFSTFFFLFAAPSEKQPREVTSGFELHPPASRSKLPFPYLRLINKLKYCPLKPEGSYVQVETVFSSQFVAS